MNQQAERRVGTVIGGKWRIDALLGSGSMAAVYAATHRNGARSALKILHPTLCTDPAVCERFLGEGYLANSVKHPGIVRVLDDGVTDDGCVFLVMDLLEGHTLEALRQERGGRIPLVEALDIADKLMDVLGAVHAAGIIHRDLKPQNVFVCNDGSIRLFDFGVARVFDRTSQSKLSVFGLVLGTPSFMSPEQALGSREKVDHRSDIWSLGATIFTSLTGETVHLGANVQARLLAAATVKARSISMVMPDLPAQLANAIDMALRFKKEDRWQSVDAMRTAFLAAREQLGLGVPDAPKRSLPPPSPDRTAELPAQGSVRPPPVESSEGGPGGTFIGIGSGDGRISSIVGNDGSVPPAPVSPSAPPAPAPGSSFPGRPPFRTPPAAFTPPNVNKGVAPRFPAVNGAKTARLDGQEGSIPAYGSTLSSDDLLLPKVGKKRKSSLGVWAAVVVVGALLGGIAFFVANPSSGPSGATGDPAALASSVGTTVEIPMPSATAPEPPPTPTVIVIGDPDIGDAADAPPEPRSTTTTTRPKTTKAAGAAAEPDTTTRPATTRTKPDAPSEPATTTPEPAKPTPPGLAPDPFGAPD